MPITEEMTDAQRIQAAALEDFANRYEWTVEDREGQPLRLVTASLDVGIITKRELIDVIHGIPGFFGLYAQVDGDTERLVMAFDRPRN